MTETQATISAWADEAFGPITSPIRAAVRANEEMAELLKELASDGDSALSQRKAGVEIADIFIVLYRCAENLGVDVHEAIESKMIRNRQRVWQRDGTGHGYHVEEAGHE